MEITVSTEQLQQPQVEVIINNQTRHVAIDGDNATLHDLFDAIFKKEGLDLRVATKNDDDTYTLNREIYILREGEAHAPTTDPTTRVQDRDSVVAGQRHHNG